MLSSNYYNIYYNIIIIIKGYTLTGRWFHSIDSHIFSFIIHIYITYYKILVDASTKNVLKPYIIIIIQYDSKKEN
jgi:hypothetical protein